MKNVKISFLTLIFAVAGMLADINSGLALICHIWGFYLYYIKLILHPCYFPIPYKKWTKNKQTTPASILLIFIFNKLKYLIFRKCFWLVLCRSKLLRKQFTYGDFNESSFLVALPYILGFNTDVIEWDRPVLMYSIWIVLMLRKKSNDLSGYCKWQLILVTRNTIGLVV